MTGTVLLDDGERVNFQRLIGIDGSFIFLTPVGEPKTTPSGRPSRSGEWISSIYFELPGGDRACASGKRWRAVLMEDGTEIKNPDYKENT